MSPAIEPPRGGFRHPISTSQFILDYLRTHTEAYIAEMHRALKDELEQLAQDRGRREKYHYPRYHSFEMQVQKLSREGLIAFSGVTEESDAPQFEQWEKKPERRYYRLA